MWEVGDGPLRWRSRRQLPERGGCALTFIKTQREVASSQNLLINRELVLLYLGNKLCLLKLNGYWILEVSNKRRRLASCRNSECSRIVSSLWKVRTQVYKQSWPGSVTRLMNIYDSCSCYLANFNIARPTLELEVLLNTLRFVTCTKVLNALA